MEEGRNLREAVKLSPFREDERNGLAAVCEYYEKQASTYFSNPMKSESANQEEFIFLFTADHLTADLFERCRDYAYNAGMEMAPYRFGAYVHLCFTCLYLRQSGRCGAKSCRKLPYL